MALEIGGGITIGGGISVIESSSGSGIPNSFTVESHYDGSYTYEGAYVVDPINSTTQLGTPDFGTINSDYIYGIYHQTNSMGAEITSILLKEGSYSGFNVFNGVIGSDLVTYPRVFTIGGTPYTFYRGAFGYHADGDILSLASAPTGAMRTALYNPSIQISLTPDTILVSSRVSGSETFYGANRLGDSFGIVVSDYIDKITYSNMSGTSIMLKDGNYPGFSVTGGAIDGDISNATRKFTINNTQVTFTCMGNSPYMVYVVMMNSSDVLNLQSLVGETIPVLYDPNAQSGGGGEESGAYLGGTDYANGTSSPPGMYIIGSGPYTVMIDSTFWTNSAGYTLVEALVSGDTFDVTMPLTGDTVFTLTLTQDWSGSPYKTAQVTSSVPLTLGMGVDNVPTSIALPSGPSSTTYLEANTTFNGTQAPPWVVTSLYNNGTLFKLTTNSDPSAEFLAAMNSLTNGSQITLLDNSFGEISITLTSGFDGTFSAGNQSFSANCTSSTVDLLYQITSMTIVSSSSGGPVTYSGWPLFYGQGVYMSGNNLQINSETNAAELWAVYGTLTTGTPISFVIDDISHSGVIGDPATGGGGPLAPYITVVPDDGNTYYGTVSSVTIG